MSQNQKPTDSELEILQVLWTAGPSTVRQVHDRLAEQKEVGYTTTLKLMQIMLEKGLLKRKPSGKTHIYQPVLSQSDAQQQLIDKLLDTAFGGSALQLVMRALSSKTSSEGELSEIRKYLDQLSEKDHKNNQK